MSADPQQDQLITIGHDQRLAFGRSGPADSIYLDEQQSQFLPKAAQNIRPYVLDHADVLPAGTSVSQVAFGSQVTFKFGNEGRPNLYAAELHVTLPKLAIAGVTPSGGVSTYCRWAPYVAEKIMSGSGDPIRFKYGTDTLRGYTAEGIHIKRTLCFDSEATTKSAAYKNSVGAIPDDATANARRYRIPLWLPQGTDDVNFHQMLPVQAFGQEFQVTFKFPALADLIQTDNTIAGVSAVTDATYYTPTQPGVFLRLHYHVPEKAERGAYANMLMSPKGLSFQTMHIARETQYTGIDSTLQTVKIPIKNSTNPCVFVVAGIRFADDLKAVGAASTSGATDTNVPPRAINASVCNPDWTRWQVWNAHSINDGGNRTTPKRGYDDWQNSVVNGISCYFPCDITTNLLIVPFSAFPRIENAGMGHMTLTTLNSPALWIDLPATSTSAPLEHANQTRVVDVFYFERNTVHMKNGNVIRVWNVQE